MKEVFIKYNPYKLETEFTVDGKVPAKNSKITERIEAGGRFQEWIEEIPDILVEEYNDNDFEIKFHGTLLDYEDLVSVFSDAKKCGKLTAKFVDRIAALETSDKEKLIDEVFQKIQKGPFEELKTEEIISAFRNAQSGDFEVCVVATMSAGKSTLINALLADKLMPSCAGACTAIITRIKDVEGSTAWCAEVYDKDGELVETHPNITLDIMNRLNNDENISNIKITGDIPFVRAEDVSLVLIDTPGPNNSRDPEHRKVQSQYLQKSSKALVLYVMEGTFGSDDDDKLLDTVAKSMTVGGKQSKDRFIFVVNKMDGRRKEDGSTEETLSQICAYLKQHGIENPNLFPAAALPALNIRLMEKYRDSLDEGTIDETGYLTKKLNKNDELHLEKFASLPASVSGRIKQQLADAEGNGDSNETALIHSGIPSIEASIRQYVQKYAKTAKIKNIVDTFQHKLDEVNCFEKTKNELAARVEENEIIAAKIAEITKKIDDGEAAKKFCSSIDTAVNNVLRDAENGILNVIGDFQSNIRRKIDEYGEREIAKTEVENEIANLNQYVKELEPQFYDSVNELIMQNLKKTCDALLEGYRKKLSSLTEDVNLTSVANVDIAPLKFIGGSLVELENILSQDLVRSKQVKSGKKFSAWKFALTGAFVGVGALVLYKFWLDDKYKNVEFIYANELAEKFFMPVEKWLRENGDKALQDTEKIIKEVAELYKAELKKLDELVKDKLTELSDYATNRELAEKRVKETQKRLDWLEDVQLEISSILRI